MVYTAYADVQYWNAGTNQYEMESIAMTQVQSMTEAMQRIESYYKENLNWCELFLNEETFIPISDEEYYKIKRSVGVNA